MADDHEERIANQLESIFERQVEALRRAGVAEGKQEGLRIESTEAVRLFREATGYIQRLRRLRENIYGDIQHSEYYHAEHILGYINDYNRIIATIRRNPSFKNAIQDFEDVEYTAKRDGGRQGYEVRFGNRSIFFKSHHTPRHKPTQTNVPMDGTTSVETAILPRLARLSEDVEESLVGRCASGKRPE